MIGPELFRLGRTLLKLGVRAIPPSGFTELPRSVRMVLVDVVDNPGTTIGAIAERTGFPQSLVSSAVARLRDEGTLVTERDEADRRRTLVSPAPEFAELARRAHTSLPLIDDVIAAELVERFGHDGPAHLPEVLTALATLSELLACPLSGPAPAATAGAGAC